MSYFENIRDGKCPNDCGDLQIFKKPIALLYVTPTELIEELYQGVDTPEDVFGHIIGHCDKCGFTLTTPSKDDAFDHLADITILGLPVLDWGPSINNKEVR